MEIQPAAGGIIGLIIGIILFIISLRSYKMSLILKVILVTASTLLIIVGGFTLAEIYKITKEVYHL
ncbi:hypothetical protein [Bacillus cereus]|uniref:Uncharacterized protein n=1 Tax=Bacillus cereus TaxID=1396 RepID=A0A2A8R778_BACCE|nr:hypothetical protein [Bacillus cereus]PEX85354.1 hypothetical protein CN450_17585 [Bacillus cereus]PFN28230.1 hypothetical protein COJ50_05970 [Bacillus cereus]